MQSVGQKLRAARLAQEFTLDQIHSSTRISLNTLEAIEADDVNHISSAFLYRSFVRQLAEYLKIDYAELSSSIQANAERMPAPLMPGEGHRIPGPKVPALQIGRRRKVRWVRSLSSFAAALVACSAIYAFWQNEKLGLPTLLGSAVPSTQVQPAAASAPSSVPAPASTAPAEPRPQQTGFTLELSATEPAWLSIVADGKVSFRGILERAETKILEGHETARIRTGNAGAVEAVFNGKAIGALGSRGQVRTVLFTKDDYEVLDSSPRISLLRFTPTFELAREIRPASLVRPVAF
ncbi:MAG TPA: RodZ domain-containing protein [Bryobacteraceae bacterium]|jgi:transcriptional regulator with XRE-family HTH domain